MLGKGFEKIGDVIMVMVLEVFVHIPNAGASFAPSFWGPFLGCWGCFPHCPDFARPPDMIDFFSFHIGPNVLGSFGLVWDGDDTNIGDFLFTFQMVLFLLHHLLGALHIVFAHCNLDVFGSMAMVLV